jgi:hypothetical protein
MTAPVETPVAPSNRGLWIGLALGLPVMAYGVGGVFVDSARTHPAELARWVIGAALVHDLVVVPVVLAVATGLRPMVPGRVWPAVRWALVTSAVLSLFALPFVRGYGRAADVPSLLNRNYGAGLLACVAVVTGIALTAAVAVSLVRLVRSGHHEDQGPVDP